jgi:hypothetical protein
MRRPHSALRAPAFGEGRCARRALAVAVAAALYAPPSRAVSVVEAPAGALPPSAPIVIRLDRPAAAADGTLAVFVGTLDLSALFRSTGETLVLERPDLPLPAGEQALVVWRVQGRQWRELYRSTLRLGDAAAQPPSAPAAAGALTPALELAFKVQADEATRGAATPPQRPKARDVTGRGGLAVDTRIGGVALRGGANVSGSSVREEALQFGARGPRARKVDLADYRLEIGDGPARLAVGHVSWGSHPLLLNGYASRGAIAAIKLGSRAEVALAAINGTSVVGFENALGLQDSGHRIYGASIGVEALPQQPGWLRVEATVTDASLRALNNFNRGEIPDAEQSRGGGLRLSSRALDGRLRADLAWSRATYRPADDPQLSQGLALTPLAVTTRWARQADIAFDLLRGVALREGLPLTLTPSVRYDEAQPLYKMLGASLSSDLRALRAGMSMQLGAAQAGWFRSARRDNLDDVATLMTTRTEADEATLSLPLPQWLGAAGASAWPQVSLQVQKQRQYAASAPSFELSGLAPTHRPDQHNALRNASLAWSLGRHSANYSVSYARQDNRQPGRENADFLTVSHQASLSFALGDALNLSLGANRSRQYGYEQAVANVQLGLTAGVQWRFFEAWSLAANAAHTQGEDSLGLASNRSLTTQTQLGRTFRLPSPFARPATGQWFVRHALASTRNDDRRFGLQSAGRQWSVNLGASLTGL